MYAYCLQVAKPTNPDVQNVQGIPVSLARTGTYIHMYGCMYVDHELMLRILMNC